MTKGSKLQSNHCIQGGQSMLYTQTYSNIYANIFTTCTETKLLLFSLFIKYDFTLTLTYGNGLVPCTNYTYYVSNYANAYVCNTVSDEIICNNEL